MDAPTVKLDLLRLYATAADPVGLARQAWAFLREAEPAPRLDPPVVLNAPPPAVRRKDHEWTADQIATLERMLAEGALSKAIAVATGRTAHACALKATDLNLPERFGPRPKGCDAWTGDNLRQLEELYAAGRPAREIAAAVGRTVAAVTYQVYRLGLAAKHGALNRRPKIPA
ncbi:MAG: hypothetical protein HQL40_05985, partial [Alphaproteobacteria bacterium]|nr:hypothetical protein [Alphaproteobacteria bacterium]